MTFLDQLEKPTLLVDSDIARANIEYMAEKARRQGVRFRPHFKTHQSAAAGEWFRQAGVSAITVSSLEMAEYFARHGWQDILVAFPVNLRQMRTINALASQICLGLLVESLESAAILANGLQVPADLWIKIDSGSGRTGLPWDRPQDIQPLVGFIRSENQLRLRGLMTHAGETYAASSEAEICTRYQTSVARMVELQAILGVGAESPLEVSVGDTPGCTLCESFGAVDEIRPGNFVFFDGQMLRLGVCSPRQVAAVLACPVVALHLKRDEVLVYGGAVHLSKDTISQNGLVHYGYVVLLDEEGRWADPLPGAYAARLSQEHGILHLPKNEIAKLKMGGMIGILPAHICLTVAALGEYRLLDGTKIRTYRSSGRG